MRQSFLLLITLWFYNPVYSQFPLSVLYSQDFNGLVSTGSSNLLPSGWSINESGSAADGLYSAGTGSGSTGDTYSFGATASAERGMGLLQSGSLVSMMGFYFTNTSGSTITRLLITYTGEQWRLGATGRIDRLDFQFSLNASTITNGDWADIDGLDFTAPVTSGLTGALDGNAGTQQRVISYTITGIMIPAGSTCFLRWTDLDAAGSDDGLAIDNFSIQLDFTIPSSKYFRSAASGHWSVPASWEVSDDQLNWSAATELPTSYAAGIEIRAGHTISYLYFTIVDQVNIATGGTLIHAGGQLIITDGAGDDLQIQNSGILHFSVAGNAPLFTGASPVIRIKTGAILRISAGGLSTVAGAGVHAANYIYDDGSILENAYNGMGANGVTYFPNVNNTTIPVLRITQQISLPVGAAAPTRINGIIEANGNISFTAAGQKVFRNGIRGTGNITTTATCGLILIDGTTAVLGGSGIINAAASAGIQIGAATGTTVTLSNNKAIAGNISLLATSTFIDLGPWQLTVNGAISGGGNASYVRSSGTGSLVMENVSVAGKLFPVGHTRYNPVLVENGSGYNWSVRVNDGVVPDFPYTSNGAVLLTWHILPSVNPPVAGASITFQFDRLTQTGGLFNTAPYDSEPLQAWHRKNDFWLAAGTPQPLVNAGGDIRTVKYTGLTEFSPYGLSRLSLPLPLKLIYFNASAKPGNIVQLNWRMAAPVPASTLFITERSLDAQQFYPADTVRGEPVKTDYMATVYSGDNRYLFYRLKVVEADGNLSYSPVVYIGTTGDGLKLLQLIPNPAKDLVMLQLYTGENTPAQLDVFDNAGKRKLSRSLVLRNGVQGIPVSIAGWPAGIYMVHIRTARTVCSKILIKR